MAARQHNFAWNEPCSPPTYLLASHLPTCPTLPPNATLPAGKLLFCDNDWLQLVARVTSPTMPLVAEDKAAAVAGLPGAGQTARFAHEMAACIAA